MKSVGEAMGIGRCTFSEAFFKAKRLERVTESRHCVGSTFRPS